MDKTLNLLENTLQMVQCASLCTTKDKKILIKLFSSVDIFQIQLLVNININSWKDL